MLDKYLNEIVRVKLEEGVNFARVYIIFKEVPSIDAQLALGDDFLQFINHHTNRRFSGYWSHVTGASYGEVQICTSNDINGLEHDYIFQVPFKIGYVGKFDHCICLGQDVYSFYDPEILPKYVAQLDEMLTAVNAT